MLPVVASAAVLLTALQSESPKTAPEPFREMTPEIQDSIERGLLWLSKSQKNSGTYGSGAAPVATTGIAAMAFLSGGHLPGRSRYGENVRRAMAFLLKTTGRSGYVNEGATRGAGGSGMHGHGYATMFLAECYGMTGNHPDIDNETIKEALTRAIRVIERAQCANGGWNYNPSPSFDEGSVTVTQVQALRAARNAGIQVDLRTIQKATEYINKSTGADGKTRYSLSSSGRTSFALTAAGMSVLNFLGSYENPKIKKGLAFVLASKPGTAGNNPQRGGWGGWYFYGNYYATLACYQAGDATWRSWWPAISSSLLKQQDPDGSWKNAESGNYGAAFGTGFALQILQIPNRYSPIYQRGKD